MGIAAPAVSRAIAALEHDLGCVLFERDGRGMRLTKSGELLHRHAVEIFRRIEVARHEVMAHSKRIVGTVSLGATPSVIGMIGTDLLRACRSDVPELRVGVVEGYSAFLQSWVLTGTVEFALINGPASETPRIVSERLALERIYAIGRPGILGAPDSAITLKSLVGHQLLLPSGENPTRVLFESAIQHAGVQASSVLDVDSVGLIKALAAEDVGIAVLPYGAARAEIEKSELMAYPIVEPEITSELNLIHLEDRPPSRAAQEVILRVRNCLLAIKTGSAAHGFLDESGA
jgi:LysR family nitrogen assimilation transcriptional regulator